MDKPKKIRLLILAFYYPPDLSAGSFRVAALVDQLVATLPEHVDIHILTTMPNRFGSYEASALEYECKGRVTIQRFLMPAPKGGFIHQAHIFLHYAFHVQREVRKNHYDLIFATSSKLFTATLGSWLARRLKCRLYLDIRDIFVDTVKDVLPARISRLAMPAFSSIEKWTMKQADQINLVSPGFQDYFTGRYPKATFDFYTNGVDVEFLKKPIYLEHTQKEIKNESPINVLYAGTIGEGQGLDLIIPQLAQQAGDRMHFQIIGDGGRKSRLLEQLHNLNCKNVELVAPMNRDALIQAYQRADVLLIHLNTHKAFHKVLPSKLFEYAATGKPVWAGIGGYAASFVREHIANAVVFSPGDAQEAMRVFPLLSLKPTNRDEFIANFSRTNIMKAMATDLCQMIA